MRWDIMVESWALLSSDSDGYTHRTSLLQSGSKLYQQAQHDSARIWKILTWFSGRSWGFLIYFIPHIALASTLHLLATLFSHHFIHLWNDSWTNHMKQKGVAWESSCFSAVSFPSLELSNGTAIKDITRTGLSLCHEVCSFWRGWPQHRILETKYKPLVYVDFGWRLFTWEL